MLIVLFFNLDWTIDRLVRQSAATVQISAQTLRCSRDFGRPTIWRTANTWRRWTAPEIVCSTTVDAVTFVCCHCWNTFGCRRWHKSMRCRRRRKTAATWRRTSRAWLRWVDRQCEAPIWRWIWIGPPNWWKVRIRTDRANERALTIWTWLRRCGYYNTVLI